MSATLLAIEQTLRTRGLGNGKRITCTKIQADGDYSTGGFDIEPGILGLGSIDNVICFENNFGGWIPDWNTATSKLQLYELAGAHTHVFTGSALGTHQHAAITAGTPAGSVAAPVFTGGAPIPLLIPEELLTVTTHVGTLAHLPLYITAVHVTAGGTTGAFSVIPTGETPLTKQVAVNFTNGAMTFLDTDAVTEAKVTYIPKQASGTLVAGALVVDEVVTAAAAKATLANRACAVQYVWDDTDGVLCTFEPVGEEPSATHKCVVDINDTGATKVDSHADDEGNTLKVTYLKYASFPAGCCVDDADLALSSEAYNFTTAGGFRGIVVPGLGVHLCGEEAGAGNELGVWEGPSGTSADGVGVWNPVTNSILTNNTNPVVTLAMPWLVIDPELYTAPTPTGTNSAPAFTGSELATHIHAAITAGTPAGTNASSAAVYTELGNMTPFGSATGWLIAIGN